MLALYSPAKPALMLAYGPMTTEYQPFVLEVVASLSAMGVRAAPLNLSLGRPMAGCFGHPSAADNVEIAAQAVPQISAFLGWQ